MKPKAYEFLLASRWVLPIWGLVGLWEYSHWNRSAWDTRDDIDKNILILIGILIAAIWLKALLTVSWYEYVQRKHARAGLDPEEIRARRKRRLIQFRWGFAFFCLATSLLWLASYSYEENPDAYLGAWAICAVALLQGLWFLVRRIYALTRKITSTFIRFQKPFIVTWSLPVPKRTAAGTPLLLPDYCQLVLAGNTPRPFAGARSTLPEIAESLLTN